MTSKPTSNRVEEEQDEDGGLAGFQQTSIRKKKTAVLTVANGTVEATPHCQVENCGIDLSNERYYRRHKVCQVHTKTPVVILAGTRQRFCQKCSRFHEVTEFDEAKSCRRRLAGHNERRRNCSSGTQREPSSIRGWSPQSKAIQGRQHDERGSALPGKPTSDKHVGIC